MNQHIGFHESNYLPPPLSFYGNALWSLQEIHGISELSLKNPVTNPVSNRTPVNSIGIFRNISRGEGQLKAGFRKWYTVMIN